MNNIVVKRIVLIISSIILILIVVVVSFLKRQHKSDIPIEEQIKYTKTVREHSKEEIGNDINDIYNNYEVVKFGNYYQNENDDKKNRIEWFVLDKKDSYALLLSKYILDISKMSDNEEECQWSESILRKWLNSKFYNFAFNDIEKEKIIECELENFNIPLSLHKKQDITKDKVFILSLEELQKIFYGDERLINEKLTTTATDYVFSKNELINFNSKDFAKEKKEYAEAFNLPISAFNVKTTTYWTRTFKDNKCLVINYDGYIDGKNETKSNLNKYNGVRPAIFIKINNIATNNIITYNELLGNNNELNIEYDLSKTPREQNLYKKNEKRAYYKQLIEKKLYPEKLKNFIDVDQLDNISGKTVDDLLQEIKRISFQNVISELLKGEINVNEFPINDNYVNNHSDLYKELKIDYDYWIGKPTEFKISDDGKLYCNVSISKVNKKNSSKVPKSIIILYFDNNGYIDDFDIFNY